jgi:hypothetical protein
MRRPDPTAVGTLEVLMLPSRLRLLLAVGLVSGCSGELLDVTSGSTTQPTSSSCAFAAGNWTALMPPRGITNYVVTYSISDAVAASGGTVLVTWVTPHVHTYTAAGTFSPGTCTLSVTYPAICASSAAAGNGRQCGDTNRSGIDICPAGDAFTANFDPPSATWWDAMGCNLTGLNCDHCDVHQATSVTR